jgi:hypothetical protein
MLREKGIEVPDGQRAIELTTWGAPVAIVIPRGEAPPEFLWTDPAISDEHHGILSDFCRAALPMMQLAQDADIVQPRGSDE